MSGGAAFEEHRECSKQVSAAMGFRQLAEDEAEGAPLLTAQEGRKRTPV